MSLTRLHFDEKLYEASRSKLLIVLMNTSTQRSRLRRKRQKESKDRSRRRKRSKTVSECNNTVREEALRTVFQFRELPDDPSGLLAKEVEVIKRQTEEDLINHQAYLDPGNLNRCCACGKEHYLEDLHKRNSGDIKTWLELL